MRVLNLWQKNSVFLSDIIQPLLDLASSPNDLGLIQAGKYSTAMSDFIVHISR